MQCNQNEGQLFHGGKTWKYRTYKDMKFQC
jgi:hypothetical protein